MMDDQTILDRSPVFEVLSSSQHKILVEGAIARRLDKGQVVACAGDVWPYLFMVVKGGIDVWKESSEGRSLVVTTFRPGDIFWGLAFFHDNAQSLATLKAREPSEILLWPKEYLLPLLQTNGAMAWELTRLMVLKMTRASEILEEMAFQPVAGRLARLLLEASPKGVQGPTTRSLTLDEMAARIGSTREMVCRFLHRFADEGIIDITRTEFRITDLSKLSELADRRG